jgi:hypothetical protein
MKFRLSKRRFAIVGAVGAIVGGTLSVVLPAVAATSTPHAGATSATQNITPTYLATGGANNCGLFGPGIGTDQYFVQSPKSISGVTQTVTALNGATVKFTITADATNKFLGFSVSGAVVTDVGIKGGNGTDWYDYEAAPVTHDDGLTAPSQSSAGVPPFYSLSQTVFCYTPKITCQPNVPLSDPQHPGETIELPSCVGKDGVYYDFSSSVDPNSGKNTVSVYAHGGSGAPTTPMVEHIAGTLAGSTQTTLQYSDTDPAGTLHDMRFCQVDPRAGGSDPLALADAYKSESSAGSVLPPIDLTNDPEDSSCLISERTWVDTSRVVHFEAYVYTDIDGQRVF